MTPAAPKCVPVLEAAGDRQRTSSGPQTRACAEGACDGISNFSCPEDAGLDATVDAGPPATGVVQVVLFVHIEDNTPPGTIGSPMSRTAYLRLRSTLLALGARAAGLRLRWVLQPDWSFLEAARVYEDAAVTADTGGANLLVHLRDVLGVAIDPHSHENGDTTTPTWPICSSSWASVGRR